MHILTRTDKITAGIPQKRENTLRIAQTTVTTRASTRKSCGADTLFVVVGEGATCGGSAGTWELLGCYNTSVHLIWVRLESASVAFIMTCNLSGLPQLQCTVSDSVQHLQLEKLGSSLAAVSTLVRWLVPALVLAMAPELAFDIPQPCRTVTIEGYCSRPPHRLFCKLALHACSSPCACAQNKL